MTELKIHKYIYIYIYIHPGYLFGKSGTQAAQVPDAEAELERRREVCNKTRHH
jgi:hypothetical protein